ncbi:MAG: transcriptional repressor [Gammaproteobacteria bacterium]|nr:transcriptional repressor [Gammaproteobacteria bacterium]
MLHPAFSDKSSRKEVVRLLTEHGITPTQQRILIAQEMLSKHQHLSADQVMQRVNAHSNTVSKATVYNTLGLFTEKGLIKEVIVDSSKVFYDSNTRHHHHFYNVDSGSLHDIECEHLAIARLPDPPAAMKIKNVEVIVRVSSKAS